MSLTRAAAIGIGADALLTVAALISAPFLVSRLGIAFYGVLVFASVLSTQFGVAQFALGPSLVRTVVEARVAGVPERMSAVVQGSAIVSIGTGLCVTGIGALLLAVPSGSSSQAASLGLLKGTLETAAAFMVLVLIQPSLSAVQSVLLGYERYEYHAAFRLALGVARTGAAMAAVAAGGTVAHALWSQAVVDGAAVLTALGVWRARRPTSSGRGALAASRLLVSRGLPFAGVSLVLVVQADAERLILGLVGHAQELALYAVPYGLLSRLTVVAGAVATALLPRLVSAEAADDARGSLELVRRSTRVLVALLAVPVIVAIAVLPEFLEAWIGSQFRVHATRPARIAAVAVMVSASIYPLDAALRASKRPSALLWIYIPQLFLLAGVYWAITRYGVVGAAGALLVRCVADGGLHEIMGTRVLGRASGAWREAVGVIAVVAGFAALCEVAGGAFPVWLRGLVAMGICGIVVWWRLQAADWQALRLATARAEQGDA